MSSHFLWVSCPRRAGSEGRLWLQISPTMRIPRAPSPDRTSVFRCLNLDGAGFDHRRRGRAPTHRQPTRIRITPIGSPCLLLEKSVATFHRRSREFGPSQRASFATDIELGLIVKRHGRYTTEWPPHLKPHWRSRTSRRSAAVPRRICTRTAGPIAMAASQAKWQ